jgi:integrase
MASFEPRGNSVRAIVRLPGGKKRTATFDTQREAERWADEIERKKAVGALAPSSAGSSRLTNGEMFEAFLDDVASKTDSAKFNRLRILNWQRDEVAALRLAATTTHDINKWIARRLQALHPHTGLPLSPATVKRELALMSAAFAYAVKDRKWIKVNPCHGVRRPPQSRARKRQQITPREVEAICIATGYATDPKLGTLTARVGACFLLALETGMRSGEILRLRPEDYWKDRRTAHVSAIEQGGRKSARSGRATVDPSRNVPLTPRAEALLDQLLATMPSGQPYIVGVNDSQRDALWRKARRQSGVEDLKFHDMKHEAATRLAKYLDVLELSHAIGTKDVRLLRDTYYINDASRSAALLPASLAG